MSTNSSIAIKKISGEIEVVYCHWDGYLEYNGLMLNEFYSNPAKVKELIDLGDISSLNRFVSPQEMYDNLYIKDESVFSHSFETPVKEITIAYLRDRHEPEERVKKKTFYYYRDYVNYVLGENNFSIFRYNYIYDEENETWYIINDSFMYNLKDVLDKKNIKWEDD